jgi:hypothetical protein
MSGSSSTHHAAWITEIKDILSAKNEAQDFYN